MQALQFNYAQGRLPGPVPLLLGVMLAVVLALLAATYHRFALENAALQQQWQARQSTLAARQMVKKQVVDPALAAEMAEAQLHIQTPWLPLLRDLEQAQQSELYWLQLAPDAKRKHLRMTVLAHQRQQGWALVERLKKQPGLADVKLNASEASEVNGLRMTTLHLEATWKY
ncbi:hypothetical protein [Methylophilus sp. TWE2]|uniref:hypothetical protein n=1 Tax=Methylophilus sp. TWE2 TaxID=1662285 RepID=UPI0006714531|nr:hypothetical protein [Methylophilus sp. TWE2]AKR42663.1 hypothetical protein ACJ67_03930 [Methylophilus sp. TWE2]